MYILCNGNSEYRASPNRANDPALDPSFAANSPVSRFFVATLTRLLELPPVVARAGTCPSVPAVTTRARRGIPRGQGRRSQASTPRPPSVRRARESDQSKRTWWLWTAVVKIAHLRHARGVRTTIAWSVTRGVCVKWLLNVLVGQSPVVILVNAKLLRRVHEHRS